MPRHLSRALDAVAAWRDDETLRRTGPTAGAVLAYLRSIASWQRFGLVIAPDDRTRIVQLCERGGGGLFIEAIGHYVCDEFKRLFLRQRGYGDAAAWTNAFPDLRRPLVERLRPLTRRFRQPLLVVRVCLQLTRGLGEPPEVWRAAALALNHLVREEWRLLGANDDRLSSRLAVVEAFWQSDLLAVLRADERGHIQRFLDDLAGGRHELRVDGTGYVEPRGHDAYVLSQVAEASQTFVADRWGGADVRTYASALASLPESSETWFLFYATPRQKAIADLARQLRAPAARAVASPEHG